MRRKAKCRMRPGTIAALIALLACLACVWAFSLDSALAEEVYFRAFFARIVPITAPIADAIPFSFHEALTIFFLVLGLRALVRVASRLSCPRMVLFSALKRAVRRFFIIAVWGIVLFYLLWGFNYFRPRLITMNAYADEHLHKNAVLALLADCNHALRKLEKSGHLAFRDEMIQDIDRAVMKVTYHLDGVHVHSAKRIKYFLSGFLSLGTFTGVTLPFLPEAHISAELYDHEKAFIIAHEKAHLYGRALESEANYIAILACLSSDKAAVRYSGVYTLTALLLASLPRAERLSWYSQMSRYTQRNFQAPAIRRLSKNKRLVSFLRRFYSAYLMTQRVEDGIANYSAALKLVLNFKITRSRTLHLSPDGRMLWE